MPRASDGLTLALVDVDSGLPLSPLQRQLPIACKQQQTTLTFKPFSTFILDTHTRTPLVTTAAANADPLEQPFQARLAHFVQEDQQTPRTCTALRVRQDRSY